VAVIDNFDTTYSIHRLEAWNANRYGCGMAVIRLAERHDASAIAAIYRPYVEGAPTSFELEAPSEQDMAARVAATLVHAPWLVAQDQDQDQDQDQGQGALLGYAYASRHRDRAAYQWSVDVSVYVDAARQRRGVGRALYASLLALLRLQGFYTAHAGITLPNAASVGLHEALGFRPVGIYAGVGFKHGAWHDVGWWQLPLRARTGSPAAPASLAEARVQPGWEAALATGASPEAPP
jgi:L-amino acid N-acyltransferase YncA